ncbi:3-deoxy-D-manno-octulosonic-acid kinase [Bacteroidales bacterium Barb6]|nr:3-deoxy-D-manno-octulosonic-acid kinase [Bacteroidales bacterium Barb6]
MKIEIHPKYNQLATFIHSLPEQFDRTGTVIYEGRNVLRKYSVGGINLVVKRFKKPHVINRFVYGTFRSSKACRSYQNALILLEKGIPTPFPVAYIEEYCWGFADSYYVSLESVSVREMREFCTNPDICDRRFILESFGLFTARLHQLGILHLDYSGGNILFRTEGNNVFFELVDINRMHFKQIGEEEGYHGLRRLWVTDEIYKEIAKGYARGRGFDEATACRWILHYKNQFMRRRK